MALTAKQRRLCEEFLLDLNGTKAAERAGYSKRTANEQAARLLAKVSAQEYIQQLKQERGKRTEITTDRVLQELAAIAFANIDEFAKVRMQEQKSVIFDEEGNPHTEVHLVKVVDVFETDKVDQAKIPALSSIKQGRDGIEVKIHDKQKALELLGRHLGMFNDKLDLTTNGKDLNEKRPATKLPDGTFLEI
jgi:phage terminase small subunit